mmetsp:Transcript_3517/g.11736  ORF Transcript_3517/g.11736 Transcript_3517/m.11736 type:complete len:669 (+) Transcript_3517:100-2106(+)
MPSPDGRLRRRALTDLMHDVVPIDSSKWAPNGQALCVNGKARGEQDSPTSCRVVRGDALGSNPGGLGGGGPGPEHRRGRGRWIAHQRGCAEDRVVPGQGALCGSRLPVLHVVLLVLLNHRILEGRRERAAPRGRPRERAAWARLEDAFLQASAEVAAGLARDHGQRGGHRRAHGDEGRRELAHVGEEVVPGLRAEPAGHAARVARRPTQARGRSGDEVGDRREAHGQGGHHARGRLGAHGVHEQSRRRRERGHAKGQPAPVRAPQRGDGNALEEPEAGVERGGRLHALVGEERAVEGHVGAHHLVHAPAEVAPHHARGSRHEDLRGRAREEDPFVKRVGRGLEAAVPGAHHGREGARGAGEEHVVVLQAQAQGGGAPPPDAPVVDTAEMVYISSMALLKMLKHGRAGVPMEVMGLMLGEFVDEYTVKCIDVFAMPQTGTGVSVEAVDPVFQTKMLDMLKQTGRPEMVVGWYHSHPGFGCWLSGVDINTQQSFEALNQRAVAVVIDPIQSVKGKVVIDAFRSINPQLIMLGQEPRQTTSNIGHLHKPSIQALIHGLNRHYYSIAISYRKNELEQKMLMNLHKKSWTAGLKLEDYAEQASETEKVVEDMLKLSGAYEKAVQQEMEMDPEKLAVHNVGKIDAKKRIEEDVVKLMSSNIIQSLGTMLDTIVF